MFANLVQSFSTNFGGLFSRGLGAVIKALLLLILAFIVAAIVRALVRKLLNTKKISEFLSKADPAGSPGATVNYIAQFVYLIVFLLFVPGILAALGAGSIAEPILSLLKSIWGYVPNILGAAIVLIAGFLIARLVRQLLIPVFSRIRVDKLQEKAGIEVPESSRLSTTLAYIVYVLILIPVIIVALQVLNIKSISDPAVNTLGMVFDAIPNIIVAALIIGLGCVIGKFAGEIIKRLISTTGVDKKLTELTEGKTERFVLSKVVGTTVQVVITVFFAVEGLNLLGLSVLTKIGSAIIGYMPNVLASLLILIVAIFVARLAEKALRKMGFDAYALIVRIAIFTIAAFMVLNQLGIASKIVESAFILILAALAVAFAVAFGIGGREYASKLLKKLEDKGCKEEKAEEDKPEDK